MGPATEGELVMKASILVAGVTVFIVAGVVIHTNSPGDVESPDYRNAEFAAAGEALYRQHCASCHGADLAGEADWRERDADGYLPAPPHDETGHTWHHPTGQLFQITKFGTETLVGDGYKSNMGGFGDILSDEEIHAVLAFIKSTWPSRIIERHDQMDAAAN